MAGAAGPPRQPPRRRTPRPAPGAGRRARAAAAIAVHARLSVSRSGASPARAGCRQNLVLVLVGREIPLARAAHGTEPRVGDVGELGSGRDAPVGVALGRVVDEPAGFAHVSHRGQGYRQPLGRGVRWAPGRWGRVGEVDTPRPAPGEEINAGPETVPRLAATVILLRGGRDALEVLLAQRNPQARFMGGAWVFPGGAVGPGDGEGELGLRAAAVRELAEEAGIQLDDPAALVPFSRWITPAAAKIRFDTWFFLAPLPDGGEPRVDHQEMVEARWVTAAGALGG